MYHKPGRVAFHLTSVALTPLALLLALAGVRFLCSGSVFTRLGHLALEPDIYVKSESLGWHPRYRAILLAPADSVVNPCLLDYWGKYIKVIRNRALVGLLRPLEQHPLVRYNLSAVNTPNIGHVKLVPAVFTIQAKYEAAHGDEALLSLSLKDQERGRQCLKKLGVPEDAWFVCLHVREPGYLPDLAYHSFRDADVLSYFQATEEVVDRGGWVVRVGDPSMKALPSSDHVIDYVHSDVRSDWMDVFCMSQCRFFLGSGSGPYGVAFTFGAPCVVANLIPIGAPYSKRDLWIPKLYWSIDENRYLTFEEILRSPLSSLWREEDFTERGLELQNNSPEEIRDLAVEMMDRLEGKLSDTEQDELLQNRFRSVSEFEPELATSARVGRGFLRQHQDLLK
jgi:putative glycosyltransferase (TIGR04372 family)